IASPAPPGRLRMREAVTASAQRAAGALPTATPFTRTIRRRVPVPPLRIAIACDISGSIAAYAPPAASAAWILPRAAAATTAPGTATAPTAAPATPLAGPAGAPAPVPEFGAADGTEKFCKAADALDDALDLSRPGAARLLVIVSDGNYTPAERD